MPDESPQPVGGCRYLAVSGCLLGLAALLAALLLVAAAGAGLASVAAWILSLV
jgi:hypothetical protein